MPGRKPKIWFDYEYLSGLQSDDAPREIFYLDEASQKVLSQLADMVLWTRTRWFNGDQADIYSLAHDIYEQLKVPMHLDDLIASMDANHADMVTYVDELESLLRASCCGGEVGAFSDNIPGPADYPTTPPATWGDGEVIADSADWEQLVCGAAHSYVDLLKEIPEQIENMLVAASLTVGAVAAILAAAATAGLGATIAYGLASAVVSQIVGAAVVGTFASTAANLENARADIVCEIVEGDASSLATAIETAIGTTPWTVLFSHIDYQSAINTMRTGSANGENLPVSRRNDCSCGPTVLWQDTTNFGTANDGMGNWTGGHTLYTNNVRISSGVTSQTTITLNPDWAPGAPTDIHVVFTANLNVDSGEQVTMLISDDGATVASLVVSGPHNGNATLTWDQAGEEDLDQIAVRWDSGGPCYVNDADVQIQAL